MTEASTVMGLDFGLRRIGVAIGQTISGTATPLDVVRVRTTRPDWTHLGRLVAEWEPGAMVLGLPTTADGAPHPLAPAVLRFARQLGSRFHLPVHTIDERLSSHEAAARLGGERGSLDAVAAQIILETWFAARLRAAGGAA